MKIKKEKAKKRIIKETAKTLKRENPIEFSKNNRLILKL